MTEQISAPTSHTSRRRFGAVAAVVAMAVGGLAPAVGTAVAGDNGDGTYTVESGDYLYGISRSTGTSLNTLLSLNGLSLSSVIHPGDVLKLATSGGSGGGSTSSGSTGGSSSGGSTGSSTGTYTVRSGDYLYGIASKTGTSISTLLSLNGLSLNSFIYPGQVLKTSGSTSSGGSSNSGSGGGSSSGGSTGSSTATGSYTVRSGDYLYGIARKTGTPLSTLLSLNNLTLNSFIYPGQVLKTTGSSSSGGSSGSGSTGGSAGSGSACSLAWNVPSNAEIVVDVDSNGTSATVQLMRRSGSGWQCIGSPMDGKVGRNGVRALSRRVSGDGTTPAGIFPLGSMTAPNGETFQFFGNGSNPGVQGSWHQVQWGDCWWLGHNTSAYNTLIRRAPADCAGESEYLPNYQNTYSRAALIGANMGPSRSGDDPGETPRAGAIFLHRHTYSGGVAKPTSGCVSLAGGDLDTVLRALKPGATYFVIH